MKLLGKYKNAPMKNCNNDNNRKYHKDTRYVIKTPLTPSLYDKVSK
ncbi:hypothetical protein swp_1078 [Shewanella piezotolerans WP3]|uniref:Uncharacterized protein n=1 Tax=Shewanella piezotolerans (strain WP3 / JCM 13877) TaxID=225849 RepID=B8CJB6_SHEPW|nr:hypothetical protein swp_1078 [Shewanella piezotolerans WP3]